MPLYRQLDMKDQFHFTACDKNLKQFPAYLAAPIESTMSIATLQNAMHCLQAPQAYARKIKKAGGDFTAQDLRNQTETILPSHNEEIKNFMHTRDTKTRISKDRGPVVQRQRGRRETGSRRSVDNDLRSCRSTTQNRRREYADHQTSTAT
jgi:hypothetical protein